MTIPFNRPYTTGHEIDYISDAIKSGKLSGDGEFTLKCKRFLEERYDFSNVLMTTSCTDALEMCALLLEIAEGDEVIIPSYTFVSTANPFILRGAKVVFVDSEHENPNVDPSQIEQLITAKTKAIVIVHYAGISCDMDKIMEIANKYSIPVVEDAAQAIDTQYNGRSVGSFGDLATFSFHETKNIICGEGGMLVINRPEYVQRAEIIREKGTNRSAFFRGEMDKYGWVDIGSSFLPSDLISAFLYAQLQNIDAIQKRRLSLWSRYNSNLNAKLNSYEVTGPVIPSYSTNNAHMFYMTCRDSIQRDNLISKLKDKGVNATFHYSSLHKSKFYEKFHDGRKLVNSDKYTDRLIRLPLFPGLKNEECDYISDSVLATLATIG